MSEARFTKGEWVASVNDGAIKRAVIYIDGGGFDISNCPNCVANAHLIAAAPEMYEILEMLTSMPTYDAKCFLESEDSIVKLLAKARGEI